MRELSAPRGDVILFTKAPLAGLAKTRLATDIGVDAATALAAAFLRDSVETASRHARRLFLAVEPPDTLMDGITGRHRPEVFGQCAGGLGKRLKRAFDEAFRRKAYRPVLIGSDSPTLPGHLLDLAHRALGSHDVVLGPTADGGYYAIGLNERRPELFDAIDWGGRGVFQQTAARIEASNLSAFYLPAWYDIDVAADLMRLKDDPLLSPATAAVMARLKFRGRSRAVWS